MSTRQKLLEMRRRLCCWDLEPKRADSFKMLMDRALRFLPQLDLVQLKALDDPQLSPCDLLVVYAWHLGEAELMVWLQAFERRLSQAQHGVWIPALVVTPVAIDRIADVLEHTLNSNWYFDLLHPDHLSSLQIRVANLLRIHDHLHELRRYEKELADMQAAVRLIEAELNSLR